MGLANSTEPHDGTLLYYRQDRWTVSSNMVLLLLYYFHSYSINLLFKYVNLSQFVSMNLSRLSLVYVTCSKQMATTLGEWKVNTKCIELRICQLKARFGKPGKVSKSCLRFKNIQPIHTSVSIGRLVKASSSKHMNVYWLTTAGRQLFLDSLAEQ